MCGDKKLKPWQRTGIQLVVISFLKYGDNLENIWKAEYSDNFLNYIRYSYATIKWML
jgi:hypothetical protein